MKHGKNKPTKDQVAFMNFLRAQGYRVEVCYGCQEAIKVILDYLGREDPIG